VFENEKLRSLLDAKDELIRQKDSEIAVLKKLVILLEEKK
ncbi:transcriptional regulator, partial [Neisseria gonorrhoeae]